jgi:DNA-binding transcriptional LysR family regulator
MELRRLRYFIVAAEEGNFHRAALRLHLTQPSLSQQILELEKELEVSLFERLPRGVRLSKAGIVFFREAQQLLARLDEAVEQTRRTSRGELGVLRIAFSELGAQQRAVAEALHAFRQSAPDVALELVALNSAAQHRALRREQIDAGFCYVTVAPDDWTERIVLQAVRYVLAISKYDPLVEKPSLSREDLVGRTLIWAGRRRAARSRDPKSTHFGELGIPLSRIIKTGSDLAAINLASVGMGIGVVLSSERFGHSDEVVFRELPGTPWRMNAVLAWRKDARSQQLMRFVDLVKHLAVTTNAFAARD